MNRHQICLLIAALSCFCVGCGGDGLIAVSGTISWNGEPIEKGMINFYPADPSQRPHGSPITDGKFQFRTSPGEKRVEVFADRPVGEPDPVMKVQRREQYIPTRYNEQTELTANVSESDRTFEFVLEEQKGDTKAGSGVSRNAY